MSLMEDARLYRQRAEAERQTATTSALPNVRNQALRSAERWDEMAERVELAQAQAVVNRAGKQQLA